MQQKCFNHNNTNQVDQCAYCKKHYCSKCLLLTGELKTIMCKNCYAIYTQKFKRSKIVRMCIIGLGAISIIPFFYVAIVDFNTPMGSTFFILSIIVSICTVINIIRIIQMKKFLVSEKYS